MKNKVPIALGKKTPKDLSKRHFTTLNFGETYPVYARPVFPNTTLKVKPDVFARTAPMVLPTMSNIDLNLNAFYVPYRYVWRYFDDFITKNISMVGTTQVEFTDNPYVLSKQFYRLIFNNDDYPSFTRYTELEEATDSESGLTYRPYLQCDFYDSETVDGVTTKYGFKLTESGKYIYHIVTSLGYNINFNWFDTNGGWKVNILPLLSYFKIFFDYYLPNQLADSAPFKQLFGYVNARTSSDFSQQSFYYYVGEAFHYCYSYYRSNYFTNAWCSPNSPTFDTDNNDYTIYNNTINDSVRNGQSSLGYSNTLVSNNSTESSSQHLNNNGSYIASSISHDQVNFLTKFARFIKRNLLSGTRDVERLASRFGVHIDDFAYGRCRYYGSSTISLNKMDVMGTGENNLGDYAGKAWFSMKKQKKFTFDCDHFGMVIITAKLQTPSQFVDGVRRHIMYSSSTDYFTPEFDGSIMQGISGSELFGRCPIHNSSIDSYLSGRGLTQSHIYGYTPRYTEAKIDIDDVTGDFSLPRYGSSIDGFILPRRAFDVNNLLLDYGNGDFSSMTNYDYLLSVAEDSDAAVTPLDVLRQTDSKQFNRIFKDISGIVDPFWCAFSFNVLSVDGSLPLDESHELQGKGKDMYFESNGVNL